MSFADKMTIVFLAQFLINLALLILFLPLIFEIQETVNDFLKKRIGCFEIMNICTSQDGTFYRFMQCKGTSHNEIQQEVRDFIGSEHNCAPVANDYIIKSFFNKRFSVVKEFTFDEYFKKRMSWIR